MAHERRDAREVGVHRVADRHALALERRRSSRRPSTSLLRDRRTRTRARRCRSARRGGSCRGGCTRPTAAGAASGAASGTTLRGGIVTNSPECPVNGSSVMQRTATRRPSSHIARLSAGSIMNPPSSASDDDSPVPKSARPFETRSSIEMRSAIRAGWLNGGGVCTMPCPSRMLLRALRRGGEEHLGRARVRVLLEEVVLDLPRVVDADAVGVLDLFERVLDQLVLGVVVPRPRQLVLVEDAELHRGGVAGRARGSLRGSRRAAGSPRARARPRPSRCARSSRGSRRATARARRPTACRSLRCPGCLRPDSPTNVRSRISVSAVRR